MALKASFALLLVFSALGAFGLELDDRPDPESPAHALWAPQIQNNAQIMQKVFEIRDTFGSTAAIIFTIQQFFPAKVTDTFPTNPLLSINPSINTYKMKVCERVAILDCMPVGSNAIPERLQGLWWSDGLGDQTIAIGVGAGRYDPKTRVGIVSVYDNRQWGYEATNSTWKGFYWTTSGAAFFSSLLWIRGEYHIEFNEDISFGQIIPVVKIFGVQIPLPTWFLDFPMEWVGQDTWKRTSRGFLVFTSDAGDYNLHRVINGDGSKGYWYNKGWLTYKDGVPLAVPYQSYPPVD
eukprot:jgi/Botrbrau1/1458/Bobra.178_3s0016.1